MTVLVVGAHPDDETLGAGATVARLTRSGREVHWLLLGEGTTSRSDGAEPELLQAQWESCAAAAAVLGVSDVRRGDLPDNKFDTVPMLEVAKLVESAVESLRPTLVLTHHRGDLNIDHRVTHDAVLVATRPIPGTSVRTVMSFEVPSSTEWGFEPSTSFAPNVFIDVTEYLEQKLDALSRYETEIREPPHARAIEASRALARFRGASSGTHAAEAFQLVRSLW